MRRFVLGGAGTWRNEVVSARDLVDQGSLRAGPLIPDLPVAQAQGVVVKVAYGHVRRGPDAFPLAVQFILERRETSVCSGETLLHHHWWDRP